MLLAARWSWTHRASATAAAGASTFRFCRPATGRPAAAATESTRLTGAGGADEPVREREGDCHHHGRSLSRSCRAISPIRSLDRPGATIPAGKPWPGLSVAPPTCLASQTRSRSTTGKRRAVSPTRRRSGRTGHSCRAYHPPMQSSVGQRRRATRSLRIGLHQIVLCGGMHDARAVARADRTEVGHTTLGPESFEHRPYAIDVPAAVTEHETVTGSGKRREPQTRTSSATGGYRRRSVTDARRGGPSAGSGTAGPTLIAAGGGSSGRV